MVFEVHKKPARHRAHDFKEKKHRDIGKRILCFESLSGELCCCYFFASPF